MTSDNPQSAKSLYDSGKKALKQNNLIAAETAFASCLAIEETHAAAWTQLGIVWEKMERASEASDAFRMAVSLNANDVDSLYNLGLSLIKLGSESEGLEYISKACDLSDNADIATSIGDTYYNLADYRKSTFFYLKAYQKDKKSPKLRRSLSFSLFQDGDTGQAVFFMRDLLLEFPNNQSYHATFADLVNKWQQSDFDPKTKKAIEICLQQDFTRHRNLAALWCGSFMTDPAYAILLSFEAGIPDNLNEKDFYEALETPFLCLGIRRIISANAEVEKIFTHIRRYFLSNWENHESWPRVALDFLSSLAIQCWYNDFIFFETPNDKQNLQNLLKHLDDNISPSEKISEDLAKLLALASCYKPLYEIYPYENDIGLAPSCKSIMKPLLKVQFKNPRYETSLIPKIVSFTEIEDTTSKAVQKMYENRPYPRWTSSHTGHTSESLIEISKGLEILVAGCGTGQEPCLYAAALPEARITAIDLSRSSIAYGMRMAEELGYLPRIKFLHGDLMKVGELNKKFDLVYSSGVLHHLKDPEKGLSAILEVLKPDGRLSISLYSKIARDMILNPASDYIKEKGYTSSLDDIRQFRQDILEMSADDPRARCMRAGDFFNLSECNDLLFHVQEHRYTFPLLQEMADRHELTPYYVSMNPEKMKRFEEMFPGADATNLDLMDQYEHKYPDAFVEMYKIYFQRKGRNTPHPADVLIKFGAI